MQESYHFDYQESPSSNDEAVLFNGINEEAFEAVRLPGAKTFAIFIKNSSGQIVGGAKGVSYYGCLYVDMLWVHKELRQLGYGTLLMQKSEQIGKERNCSFAAVNTMNWEALPFYEKLGYEVEFVREGYDKSSTMHFLRKNLK